MKGLFFTLMTLLVTIMPGARAQAEEAPYHIDGLGQFRLNEDLVERILSVREDIKENNISAPYEEEFKSPADIISAMDSSPEFTAILVKNGLTSKDIMLFMAAMTRAMGDAEKQPTIDASIPEESLSPREVNRIFYIRHKADIDSRLGPLEDEEDMAEDVTP